MSDKSVLQRVLESCEIECRAYSGRSMFGERCLGVDLGRDMTMGRFFAAVLEGIESEGIEVGDAEYEIVIETFQDMCMDSMGLGSIVYFPGTPYDGSDDEESTP